MVQTGQTSACFDADFLPFGREKDAVATCTQNDYKFEGKERDTETGNDDFGARYYSSNFGRWLSPDWSSTPAPVPYANLTNPQTLNLYAMVEDDPESFADLDGHVIPQASADIYGTCNVTNGNGCNDNEQSLLIHVPANVGPSPQKIADWINTIGGLGDPYALTYTPLSMKAMFVAAAKGAVGSMVNTMNKASDFLNDHPLLALAPELYRFVSSEGSDPEAEQALEDEGSAIESAAEAKLTDIARALGAEGEAAVGDIGPKVRINIPGTDRYRIPDGLTNATLSEVKNVRSLSYTQQLRDFAAFSQANGRQFDLYVRPSTQLSGPLLQARDAGIIIIKYIPGAQ